jgi:hypothetical protein
VDVVGKFEFDQAAHVVAHDRDGFDVFETLAEFDEALGAHRLAIDEE